VISLSFYPSRDSGVTLGISVLLYSPPKFFSSTFSFILFRTHIFRVGLINFIWLGSYYYLLLLFLLIIMLVNELNESIRMKGMHFLESEYVTREKVIPDKIRSI
jgi:energy-coupling factor transporter transmembrane protein EcfT